MRIGRFDAPNLHKFFFFFSFALRLLLIVLFWKAQCGLVSSTFKSRPTPLSCSRFPPTSHLTFTCFDLELHALLWVWCAANMYLKRVLTLYLNFKDLVCVPSKSRDVLHANVYKKFMFWMVVAVVRVSWWCLEENIFGKLLSHWQATVIYANLGE